MPRFGCFIMLKSAFFKKLGTYHKAVYKPYTLWPPSPDAKYHLAIESSGMRRRQNFEIVLGFKNDAQQS